MLTPYMLVSAIPPNPIGPADRSWIGPVVKHCASIHATWAPANMLTSQEMVVKGAVEEVLFEICSVLGDIWVDAFDSEGSGIGELEWFLGKWESDISELMDWLEWSVWLKCDPICGPEVSSWFALLIGLLSLPLIAQEICYIPTAPWKRADRNEDGRVDMTPRCVEAVAPYSFLVEY